MKSIAVLGLGNMGAGMARRLLQAGYEVTVYNRTRERAGALAADGAKVATSPKQAAEHAEMVIAMLADDHASRAAWTGDAGALAGARPGTILIDSSTLSVDWVRELAAAAAAHGCPFIEAPVTGSKPQAEAGELLFLAGGESEAIDAVRPILATMSRAIVHLGPIGSGATMKLVNNFLCGVEAAALAEALAVIENSGLNRDAAFDILANGAPGSPLLKGVGRRMMSRDYRVNFALRLMLKDMTYAVAEGARNGVTLKMAEAARDKFRAAVSAGLSDKDFAAIADLDRPASA
jgi:3-hydroxyisobutyrate dehydrogenase